MSRDQALLENTANRPSHTVPLERATLLTLFPGSKLPGYYHSVPPGRLFLLTALRSTPPLVSYTLPGYAMHNMAHVIQNKKKLLARVSRIRGQINGIERALEEKHECGEILLTLAACRGALNSLMAEILEGHVRQHVLNEKSTKSQVAAGDELIEVIKRYLK
jgi:FrmR/RcnR family transcriptional regulator, repressor of rcnA expression